VRSKANAEIDSRDAEAITANLEVNFIEDFR